MPAVQNLSQWWQTPQRAGARRLINPVEYRHLRAAAGVRVASGVTLLGLAAVTRAYGGDDRKTRLWTAAFLAPAVANLAFAAWEVRLAGLRRCGRG